MGTGRQKKNMKKYLYLFLLLCVVVACEKEESPVGVEPNEEEEVVLTAFERLCGTWEGEDTRGQSLYIELNSDKSCYFKRYDGDNVYFQREGEWDYNEETKMLVSNIDELNYTILLLTDGSFTGERNSGKIHIFEKTNVYAIGDIYKLGNTKGIFIKVDSRGRNGWIVTLNNGEKVPFSTVPDEISEILTGETEEVKFRAHYTGGEWWYNYTWNHIKPINEISSLSDIKSKYPAIGVVVSAGEGWMLPEDSYELYTLIEEIDCDHINSVLKNAGADPFDEYGRYWTYRIATDKRDEIQSYKAVAFNIEATTVNAPQWYCHELDEEYYARPMAYVGLDN